MSARRWLSIGVVLITVFTFTIWFLNARDVETPALAEADGATPPVAAAPTPRSEPAEKKPTIGDAGVWDITVINRVDGAPVAGAQVNVGRGEFEVRPMFVLIRGHAPEPEPETPPLPRLFTGVTDEHGHLRVPLRQIDDSGSTPLRIKITRDYFHTYFSNWEPGQRVLLEPYAAWKGRVLAASGAPVAGARVMAVDDLDAETRSAADGSFVLALPAPGPVLAEFRGAFAAATAVEGSELELKLRAPEQLSGTVIGNDERPVPGVTITARIGAFTWTTLTRPNGSFRVPGVGALQPSLRLEKPGYEPLECDFSEELTLQQRSRLEGTLVDQRGQPMPGVEVELGVEDDGFSQTKSTITDGIGQFSFEGVLPDEPTLRAPAGDATPDEARAHLTVALPEGKTTKVTLAMPPPRDAVEVKYLSVADVEVSGCQTIASPVPAAGWSSTTNSDDTLLLTRGRFHFDVRCIDDRTANETREVDPTTTKQFIFVVRGDGGAPLPDELPPEKVRVKVVDPSGAPVAGAAIDCGGIGSATSDATGRGVCEVRADDASWPMPVRASKEALAGMTRTTGKDEVIIVLRSLITLRGRVEGHLPPGAWMVAVRSAQEPSTTPLVGSSFALEGRPATRAIVCIEGAAGNPGTLGCAVSESGEEVVITVGAPGKITFNAIDAAGNRIQFPVAYFDRESTYVHPTFEGFCEFEAPPGDHILILNVSDSRARYEARVTVKPGETTALGTLKLE